MNIVRDKGVSTDFSFEDVKTELSDSEAAANFLNLCEFPGINWLVKLGDDHCAFHPATFGKVVLASITGCVLHY